MDSKIKPHITFISVHNPHDQSTWSGLNFFILNALSKHFHCEVITGFNYRYTFWLKAAFKLSQLFGFNFCYEISLPVSRQLGKLLSTRIPPDTQLIFTVNSHLIPFLRTSKPVIIYKDSTFNNLYGYYDFVSRLSPWDKRIAHWLEGRAFRKASTLFFSSEWAVQSAVKRYKISSKKVQVIPFGANFQRLPDSETCIKMIENRLEQPLKLIFVGKDFERKGGVLAQQVVLTLHKLGSPVSLHFYSEVPENLKVQNECIQYHGLINKAKPKGEQILWQAYSETHFLLLPSTAECFGVVFAEAAAFGIPSITFATGGTTTAVQEDENGWCLPMGSDEMAFVTKILFAFQHYKYYASKARKRFEQVLNWDVAGQTMSKIIFSYLDNKCSSNPQLDQ